MLHLSILVSKYTEHCLTLLLEAFTWSYLNGGPIFKSKGITCSHAPQYRIVKLSVYASDVDIVWRRTALVIYTAVVGIDC